MRDPLTDAFFGYTMLEDLQLCIDPHDGSCNLTFTLARNVTVNPSRITVRCLDVQQLQLSDIGEGTQFLYVLVEDISDQGLDRVNYLVREEDETICFVCRRIEVVQPRTN